MPRRRAGRTGQLLRPGFVVVAALAALLPLAGLLPAASAQAGVAGTWGKARELRGFTAPGNAVLGPLSCGSPGNCAAGGGYNESAGHGQGVVLSEVNGTWRKPITVPGTALRARGGANVLAVSCAASGYCAAGGVYTDSAGLQQAFVITSIDGLWRRAIEVPGLTRLNQGGEALVASVSCPSAGSCAAGGYSRR